MRKKLLEIIQNPLLDDSMIESKLMDMVYERNKGKTLQMFLKIQELDKQRIERELNLQMMAVSSGMHSLTHIIRLLTENKTSRKAKLFIEMLLNGEGGLSYIIDIGKAVFPKGKPTTHSNNGRWFFDKLEQQIVNNRESFKSGGDSYSWATNYNHLDFINLILENYDNKESEDSENV